MTSWGPALGGYTGPMTPLLAVTEAPLDLDRVVAAVARQPGVDGAVVRFLGLLAHHTLGRRVVHLEYEAYEALALKVFAQIVEEAHERWPGARLAVHHRI